MQQFGFNKPSSSKRILNETIVISSDSEEEYVLPSFHSSSGHKPYSDLDLYKNFNKNYSSKKQKQVLKRKITSSSQQWDESFQVFTGKKPRFDFTCADEDQVFGENKLSRQIHDYWLNNAQERRFLQKKLDLAHALEKTLKRKMNFDCEIFIVGSSLSGFGQRRSDCDMCLVVDHQSTTIENYRVKSILDLVRGLLKQTNFVKNLQLIPAKVRILRFEDKMSHMQCDINVNNLTGIRNTHLLRAYADVDPRVQPITIAVKEWAHFHNVNDASMGTLCSYAIVLLVIHYLQMGVSPCVVPNLQLLYPHLFSPDIPLHKVQLKSRSVPSWRSKNKQSLSQLLVGFFRYYSKFDFDDVISIRLGECFTPRLIFANSPWFKKRIRLEEPFDRGNVARAVQEEKFILISSLIRTTAHNFKEGDNLRDLFNVT